MRDHWEKLRHAKTIKVSELDSQALVLQYICFLLILSDKEFFPWRVKNRCCFRPILLWWNRGLPKFPQNFKLCKTERGIATYRSLSSSLDFISIIFWFRQMNRCIATSWTYACVCTSAYLAILRNWSQKSCRLLKDFIAEILARNFSILLGIYRLVNRMQII